MLLSNKKLITAGNYIQKIFMHVGKDLATNMFHVRVGYYTEMSTI